jgi:hypothetical protein
MLWVSCKDGQIEWGKKVSVARTFRVAPRTVSRVWGDVCSNMEAHLIKEMSLEGLHFFDKRTLPFIQFPDHVFQSKKKNCGGHGKKDRKALAQIALNIPLNQRGTYRDLALQLDVSKDTVKNLVKEGVLRIHSSAVKPYLTDANRDERFQWAVSKIDLASIAVLQYVERDCQFVGMFDKVHVDKKWFNKMFEKRCYLLVNHKEDNPNRSIRHKKHIPKIMFLCAQARPRHDPHRNCMWDGKLALIPIGHWVRAKR